MVIGEGGCERGIGSDGPFVYGLLHLIALGPHPASPHFWFLPSPSHGTCVW